MTLGMTVLRRRAEDIGGVVLGRASVMGDISNGQFAALDDRGCSSV